MEYERKEKLSRMFKIAGLALLAVIGALLIYFGKTGRMTNILFGVLIGGGLLCFWLLMDVASPLAAHVFDDLTQEQVKAYRIFALLELAGYAGLTYFAVAVNSRTGIYGAVAFAATMMYKRQFYSKFLGESDEEDEEEEEVKDEDKNQAEIEDRSDAEIEDMGVEETEEKREAETGDRGQEEADDKYAIRDTDESEEPEE